MRLWNCYGRSRLSEEELERARDLLKRVPATPSFASQMPFIDGCEVSWKSNGMASSQAKPPSSGDLNAYAQSCIWADLLHGSAAAQVLRRNEDTATASQAGPAVLSSPGG